jgi:NTE family protein
MFMNLPTSFALPPEDIDRLRDMAGRLMRQSPEYATFVQQMGGSPAGPASRPQP